MAKISVHIEADNPAELHDTLLEMTGGSAIAGLSKQVKSNKAAEPVPMVDSGELPTADSDPATAPAPVTKEKKITHEDLRFAMQPLKREVSLQLVAEFSGKTTEEKPKLSDVPAEKHAELIAESHRLAQIPENVKQEIA